MGSIDVLDSLFDGERMNELEPFDPSIFQDEPLRVYGLMSQMILDWLIQYHARIQLIAQEGLV